LLRRLTLASVTALALLSGCGEPRRPPNLVLIVVDTLRADALGSYGNPAGVTPNLDAIAARGTQFRECLSSAPWTLPAVATLLTGRQPSGHGANRLQSAVTPGASLIPEALTASGYESGAFVSNHFLQEKYGLHRGFDHLDGSQVGDARSITSPDVTEAAIQWVETAEPRPFFLFLFYMDPHYEYMAQPGGPLPEYSGPLHAGQDIWDLRDRTSVLGPADFDYLRALYQGEVRAVDRAFGRLCDWLRDTGQFENTYFIITADHGEQLGERGWIGHTRNLHGELLDVPLLIAGPAIPAPVLRNDPAALIDIYPTVLQLLGQAPARLPGRGLFSPDPEERVLYAEVTYDPQAIPLQNDPTRSLLRARELTKVTDQRAVQKGRWKLVRDRIRETWALYDRETDPGERRDLADSHPAVVDALQKAFPPPGSFEVPADSATAGIGEEEMERLRNLGYVR
jgi:arylsulfatase A-like enzyme